MRLGVLLGMITDAADTNRLANEARMYESEGFESIWSAHAIGRGFMHTDPFVTLSVAAMVTGVELGTAIVQVPLYHPVDLAHRVLSLRQICGNRLIFGVGTGSTQSDFTALDRDFESRFRDFSSSVNRLRQLFSEGVSDGIDLSPDPALKGGPPIYFGTWGKGVERAAKSFDGWIASGHYRTTEEVIAALRRYRGAGGERAIVSTIILEPDTDLGQLRDRLSQFAEAGFDDAVVMFTPGGPSPVDIRTLVH